MVDVPSRYLISLILFLRLIREVNLLAPRFKELQFGRFIKNGKRVESPPSMTSLSRISNFKPILIKSLLVHADFKTYIGITSYWILIALVNFL
jgi:hypothetical protein